jgi:hypothetical protein
MKEEFVCSLPISLHKIENNLEFVALDLKKFTTLTASVRTVFKMAGNFYIG